MKKKEKINGIIKILEDLYPKPPIPLIHKDAFTLLISVLLSAQTTDKKVNEVTPNLFKIADNPFKMKLLEEHEIKEYIKQIGLSNTKARHIKKLSEILVNDYNGIVPNTFEDLEKLPGVGHKTASVVMSQYFGEDAFPVDTHIHRLMKRWNLSSGKSVVQTEIDAKKIFPKNKWNTLHLQIIYYGREYSPAKGWKIDKDIVMKFINQK